MAICIDEICKPAENNTHVIWPWRSIKSILIVLFINNLTEPLRRFCESLWNDSGKRVIMRMSTVSDVGGGSYLARDPLFVVQTFDFFNVK